MLNLQRVVGDFLAFIREQQELYVHLREILVLLQLPQVVLGWRATRSLTCCHLAMAKHYRSSLKVRTRLL